MIHFFGHLLHKNCLNLNLTLELFDNCGLAVNKQKLCIVPMQRMAFLGFLFDSVTYSISVTAEKQHALFKLIKKIHDKPRDSMTIRHLAKVIRKIVSIFPACDKAKLHYRTLDLEQFKTKMVLNHSGWGKQICLSDSCLKECEWWFVYLQSCVITKSLSIRKPTVEIYSDASGFGYGSMWNRTEVQGLFMEKQKLLSINTEELLAIYYALGAHAAKLSGEVVLIRCDKTTAISWIKHHRSADVLRDKITVYVFELAHKFNF